MRAKELGGPGVATANRRNPMKLTMTDMGAKKLRYAQGPTKRHGAGRKDEQADDS